MSITDKIAKNEIRKEYVSERIANLSEFEERVRLLANAFEGIQEQINEIKEYEFIIEHRKTIAIDDIRPCQR